MKQLISHPPSDSYFYDRFTSGLAAQGCELVNPGDLRAGAQIPAGCGFSTVLPDMDFETYSEAGFIWNEALNKYVKPRGATKKGLGAVGACVYTEHPSAEVLSLAYNLKDGRGPQLWFPTMALPLDLFAHIATGGLLEAWNSVFEYWVWTNICAPKMGWPALPYHQLRDAMAKAQAFALPGGLEKAGVVVNADTQKDSEGKRLLKKFSIPRDPTKKNPGRRTVLTDDWDDAAKLFKYNLTDIEAEAAISAVCPDLPIEELNYWLNLQLSNIRGIGIDTTTVNAGVNILDQAEAQYNDELKQITGGVVARASEIQKLIGWLGAKGVITASLDAAHLATLLDTDLPPECRRVLEIRQAIGSAGVKKLYAMQRMVSSKGRVHDLAVYHGSRTGRDGGRDLQPLNLVKAGPKLNWCDCGKPYGQSLTNCPYCGAAAEYFAKKAGWSWKAYTHAVEVIRTGSFDEVQRIFGDAILTLSGCIRGMFLAGLGKDYLCSDYSSIEAVVAAVLAGEQWRVDAFNAKQDIYLVSASRITGTPIDEYLNHPNGPKGHPDRQKIGKVSELGLGFGGWIGAWRQFDSSDTFTDDEVKKNIIAWRGASPAIVEMWGGQVRGKPWSPDGYLLYGLEGMAIAAIQHPGQCYEYRGIAYGVKDDALYCRLPSGRFLTYHHPRLAGSERWEGQLAVSFEGYNTNPAQGPMGWVRMNTYSGKLFENVVQAVARDIMANAAINLERAGYAVVLRVHDEIICEVPEGWGSIEEVERIMGILPAWAEGWPIRAEGGWRGKRYRKD